MFFSAVLCGVLVITSKNPIVSVLFLIGLFFSIACYLIVQGTTFIGLSYLLVYVGAVSILFLFILMLINIRISELTSDTSNSVPLSILVSFIFYSVLYNAIPKNHSADQLYSVTKFMFSHDDHDKVSYVTSKMWDGYLAENSHIGSLGNVMYTSYFMWLILSSFILLLAMVGAIIITIKETK